MCVSVCVCVCVWPFDAGFNAAGLFLLLYVGAIMQPGPGPKADERDERL